MVLGRNLQVQSNAMTIGNMSDENKTKEQYQKLSDTIQQTSAALAKIIGNPAAAQDLKTVAQGTTVALSSLGAMFEAQSDVSDDDYKLTELQMDEANYQLVKSAQSLFSVYYQLQYNLEQMENTRATLQENVKQAQVKLNLGEGTFVAVDDAENAVISLDNNAADLQNQAKQIGYQMNQLLGHSYNDAITFGKMPEPDTTYASKVNLSSDITTATAASYNIQIKQQQLAILCDETSENRDQRQIARNGIDTETQKIAASLSTQYDTVKKQQAALTLEQKKLESLKLKRDQAQTQYNLGTISLIALDTAKNNYFQQETTVKTAMSTLFWDIELYRWIVKGLPAS